MKRFQTSHHEKVASTLATLKQGATMKWFLLFSMASATLLLCVISVHSVPANTGGQSAQSPADAEREAWKKIREQTADFLEHEREYVMSQRNPTNGTVSGEAVVAEKAVSAVNSAPVAAVPDSAATTLPPLTTVAPTNTSSTSVGNTADVPQTTTPAAG